MGNLPIGIYSCCFGFEIALYTSSRPYISPTMDKVLPHVCIRCSSTFNADCHFFCLGVRQRRGLMALMNPLVASWAYGAARNGVELVIEAYGASATGFISRFALRECRRCWPNTDHSTVWQRNRHQGRSGCAMFEGLIVLSGPGRLIDSPDYAGSCGPCGTQQGMGCGGSGRRCCNPHLQPTPTQAASGPM